MKSLMRIIAVVAMAIVMVACVNKYPVPTPEPTPRPTPEEPDVYSYTIMIYGCGGATLDSGNEHIISVLSDYLDIPENINIVGQMKWSNGYRSSWSDGKGGVTRLHYNHTTGKYDKESISDNSFRIDDSANLAEFITWAREEAPADEYIMVFLGHGNSYHPGFEGDATRALLRDDEEIAYLGLEAVVEAFESVDARFSLTYMISCLMNSLEYATELTPYTSYYLAPNHVHALSGAELYNIVEHLISVEKPDAATIVDAVEYFLDSNFDAWLAEKESMTLDATLTKCGKLAALNGEIRKFVDVVVALYDEEATIGADAMLARYGFTTQTIDEALGNAYYPIAAYHSESELQKTEWYRISYSFDVVDIAAQVAAATNDSALLSAAEKIRKAAAQAIAYQRAINLEDVESVYYNVTLVNQQQWASLGYEAAGYESTTFDRVTGWSRLLKRNNATYIHCR